MEMGNQDAGKGEKQNRYNNAKTELFEVSREGCHGRGEEDFRMKFPPTPPFTRSTSS